MYRFLLTPRWLAVSLLALLAVPVCVFMGSWQLSRFESRVSDHRTAQHEAAKTAEAPPVPLARALPSADAQLKDADSGRVVSVTGHYDGAHQLLVPHRTLDGRDGYYVLTPLRVDSGAALPVVRGWLPGTAPANRHAGAVPAVPAGQVTVVGALQYPETTDTTGVDTSGGLPADQLGMISSASLVNLLPYSVYNGWITAAHPLAPLKAVPPAALPDSGLDLKAFQNLGYTGQWFVFAGFVVFMWFRFVRREAEARADAELGLLADEDGDGSGGDSDGAGRDSAQVRGESEPNPDSDPDSDSDRDAAAAAHAG
ncbi:SURF1 family protein [Actinacidiphila yeochonensis]|uniref:SURF1 family protein n=1 Tax=Actinacidiphila yeochonensis TaxID=89050 RepID=UPI0007C7B33E|nr:SURF1 family protein [Actinacidiphila yeochonensis]